MGAIVDTLEVLFKATTGQFDRKTDASRAKIEALEKAAKKVSVGASVAFAGMALGIGKVSEAAGVQLLAQRQLQSAFAATGKAADIGSIERLASSLQGLTLFGDEASLSAATFVARMGATGKQVEQLLPHIQDLAAGIGIDLNAAAKTVGKAVAGNIEGFNEFGIKLSESEAKAFKMASTSERTAIIIRELSSRFKGAAQIAASTASGAWTQLTNSIGDTAEGVGMLVESPLREMLVSARAAVDTLNGALASMAPETKAFVGRIVIGATAVTGLVGALAGVVAVGPKIVAGFKAAGLVMSSLSIPLLAVGALIGTAMIALGAMSRAFGRDFKSMTEVVTFASDYIGDKWAGVIDWMAEKTDPFVDGIKGAWVEIRRVIDELIRGGLQNFNDMLAAVFAGINKVRGFLGNEALSVPQLSVPDSPTAAIGGAASNIAGAVGGAAGRGGAAAAAALAKLAEAAAGAGGELFDLGKEGALQVKNMLASVVGATDAQKLLDSGAIQAAAALAGAGGGGGSGTLTGSVDKVAESADAASESMGGIGDMVLGFASQMGTVGELIRSGAQGFAQGGPIGAIINVLLTLLSKLDSFQVVMGQVEEGFDMIFEALSPLLNFLVEANERLNATLADVMDGLGYFAEGLSDAFGALSEIMTSTTVPIMKALEPLLAVLGGVLKLFGALASALDIVSPIFNALGDAMGSLDQAIKDIKAAFDVAALDLKIFFENLDKIMFGGGFDVAAERNRRLAQGAEITADALARVAADSAKAADTHSDFAEQAPIISRAFETLAESADKVTESLTNVPRGIKVALGRFRAQDPTMGGGLAAMGAGGGGMSVTINSHDAYDTWRKVTELNEQRAYDTGNSNSGSGSRWQQDPKGS